MGLLAKRLQACAARLISSQAFDGLSQTISNLRATITGQASVCEVWLRADDPYSYLLAQVMPEMSQRFSCQWHFYLIEQLQTDMYPEPGMWRQNALADARLLASLYDLPEPRDIPSDNAVNHAQATLLQQNNTQPDWQQIADVFSRLWCEAESFADNATDVNREQLALNEQRLKHKKHYLSATLHFRGEWFWGLDRLDHLEHRLNSAGLNNGAANVRFDRTWRPFCLPYSSSQRAAEKPLTLFFSIRSPYSHLGIERAAVLARHYNIPLQIKPVLPMMMRGLYVPPTKKMYIFRDTCREARKLNIDYGFVADPLGDGVKRCYALFDYAQSEGKALDYLLAYSRAVNAQGIASETDAGLQRIVERAGLSWQTAQAILARPDWDTFWQDWAEANRQELVSYGQWGVPSFHYGDLTVWGQDRLVFIEKAIRASTTPEH